jgi:hypothetical protein
MAERTYHRAAKVDDKGRVSALCSPVPRAINMKVATWTNRDEAVTCTKCLALIHATNHVNPAPTVAHLPADDTEGGSHD